MMFAQELCGCPREPWRYPYRCYRHTSPRVRLPGVRAHGWYKENTCQFCGRVNPAGLACDHAENCSLCGVVSCARHAMACYQLNITCPREINPRSKVGRALMKALKANLGLSIRAE